MEQTSTRRRAQANQKCEYPLVYQLVILLRSHKEVKFMCTSSSFALRIACLCDLAINNAIMIGNNNAVKTVKRLDREIEKEFIYRIGQCKLDPKRLVKALNGELDKDLAVKQLRNRVYKELEAKNIIIRNMGTVYNKITLINFDIWEDIHGRILRECRSNQLSIENKVILLALDYINKLESLLLQCNEVDASSVVKNVNECKFKIREGSYEKKDALVYEFLKILIK